VLETATGTNKCSAGNVTLTNTGHRVQSLPTGSGYQKQIPRCCFRSTQTLKLVVTVWTTDVLFHQGKGKGKDVSVLFFN
jgi:hypothetical protein